ncbi:DUF2778 domain-containing protein [Pandoraea oxalativorans]|uniref:DUF2778 domain-containing protein n=1 Tax=Pandoraea oxalativorans TaxID=573737 RepID=UPI0009FFA34D|nr:DUF2778 domain-containing protein [Pandoraea oxalativorans]
MPLQGKFVVSGQDLSPLVISGVGTFPAFSGDGSYRNQGGCTARPNQGPIPAGRYWIVDRPKGGVRTLLMNTAVEVRFGFTRSPVDYSEWFALYRDDGMIDDYTWTEGVKRGNFRLHPAGGRGISLGCITLQSRADYAALRRAILKTPTVHLRDTGLSTYGWIDVTTYGNACSQES